MKPVTFESAPSFALVLLLESIKRSNQYVPLNSLAITTSDIVLKCANNREIVRAYTAVVHSSSQIDEDALCYRRTVNQLLGPSSRCPLSLCLTHPLPKSWSSGSTSRLLFKETRTEYTTCEYTPLSWPPTDVIRGSNPYTSPNRPTSRWSDNMAELAVGQVVELKDGVLGTVRFVGQTHFAAGDWVGVELEDGGGKNDGSVQGERYFECEMGRGMFVRPTIVVRIVEQPAPAAKPANGTAAAKRVGRPVSAVSQVGGRRMSAVPDVGAPKRMSMNAASPSPATRGSRPSSIIRVSLLAIQLFAIAC